MAHVEVFVNDQPRSLTSASTLADLVSALEVDVRHVAVEVNRELVPRSRHGEYLLQPGDRLEIVTLVGGG